MIDEMIESAMALENADQETIIASVAARHVLSGKFIDSHFVQRGCFSKLVAERAEWLVAYYAFAHGEEIIDKKELYKEMCQRSLDFRKYRDKEDLHYFLVVKTNELSCLRFPESVYHYVTSMFPLKKQTIKKYGFYTKEQAEYAMWRMKKRIEEKAFPSGRASKFRPEDLEVIYVGDEKLVK